MNIFTLKKMNNYVVDAESIKLNVELPGFH